MIRRLAIDHHIALITNLQSALIILQCLLELADHPSRSDHGRSILMSNLLYWQRYYFNERSQPGGNRTFLDTAAQIKKNL